MSTIRYQFVSIEARDVICVSGKIFYYLSPEMSTQNASVYLLNALIALIYYFYIYTIYPVLSLQLRKIIITIYHIIMIATYVYLSMFLVHENSLNHYVVISFYRFWPTKGA